MSHENNVADTEVKKSDNGTYQNIRLINLVRFHDHAFEDYMGDQFNVLVESIQVNGLIHHIAVRPHPTEEGKFEILSGHNRVAVAKHLGWSEIPSVILDMTDDEVILFGNEANVTQRRFENWLSSEKSKSIYQFHASIRKQGRRTDRATQTSGENNQKSKFDARKETARVYRVSENTVRLYLDLYRLIEPLKTRVDKEEFGVSAARNISFISKEGMSLLNEILDGGKDSYKITVDNSSEVRNLLEGFTGEDAYKKEEITDKLRKLLAAAKENEPTVKSISKKVKKIPLDVEQYERWFLEMSVDTAADIIVKAMEFYYERTTENDKTNATNETAVPTDETDENIDTANNNMMFPKVTKEDKKPTATQTI